MLENLSKYKILLASKSPRRRELFSDLRIPFNIINIRGIDESFPMEMSPDLIPEFLANKKADEYISTFNDNELIITADTLVILNDKVLGKPKDRGEAIKMLKELSGKKHKVITGVCITSKTKRKSFSVMTEVKFATIEEKDIIYYVNTFKPFDKAGAYGIQEWIGCISVEWIKGSYYNVMGLPVQKLYEELRQF